jgi:hypothetical protein
MTAAGGDGTNDSVARGAKRCRWELPPIFEVLRSAVTRLRAVARILAPTKRLPPLAWNSPTRRRRWKRYSRCRRSGSDRRPLAHRPASSAKNAGLKISGRILFQGQRSGAACRRTLPFAPMRRPHVQPFLGLRLHPAVENAAARKYECVLAFVVDDGELKIAVEWGGGNVLPHRQMFGRTVTQRIDLNHVECARRQRRIWRAGARGRLNAKNIRAQATGRAAAAGAPL